MFANNNHEVVRRLARRSLVAAKKRNLAVALTIALSVCLMMVLCLTILGTNEVTVERMRGRSQANFVDMTAEQLQAIQAVSGFEEVGAVASLGKRRVEDYYLNISSVQGAIPFTTPLIGRMPEADNEVAVYGSMLEHLERPLETGQSLVMDLGYGPESFTVSGFQQNENDALSFTVYVSSSYLEQHVEEPRYTVYVRLADSDALSHSEIMAGLTDISNALGLADEMDYNFYFFAASAANPSTILTIALVCFAVLFASCFVIYAMFYISVGGRIQEYGRLKVIGATDRMLRRMVRIESDILATAGIVTGATTGGAIAYAINPEGWRWTSSLICAAIIAVVALFAVKISTRTPVRMAAKVSPVEAVRYLPDMGEGAPASSGKLHRSLTPIGLAGINMRRNRRKMVYTFISLGFSGVFVACIATLQSSFDAVLLESNFIPGDYNAYLSADKSQTISDIQRTNPMDESLLDTLRSIKGVTDVSSVRALEIENVVFPTTTTTAVFTGLNRTEFEQRADLLQEGTLDYDALLEGDGLVITDIGELVKGFYDFDYELGSVVDVPLEDGAIKRLTVMAIMPAQYLGLEEGSFLIVPEETLDALRPEITNKNAAVVIHASPDTNQLRKQVFAAIPNDNFDIVALQDEAGVTAVQFSWFQSIITPLMAFVMAFGILQLVNTLVTNLIARRRELSVFQSIGMTGGQLRSMLGAECLLYVAGTAAITLVLGTAVGAGVCALINRAVAKALFGQALSYHFPVLELVIYFGVLLLISFGYYLCCVCFLTGKPLAQRISADE